jgi:hypothetical protein
MRDLRAGDTPNLAWKRGAVQRGLPNEKTPAEAGVRKSIARGRRTGPADQNVTLQLSMRPVSPPALSFTRRRHVPLSTSPDRFTV